MVVSTRKDEGVIGFLRQWRHPEWHTHEPEWLWWLHRMRCVDCQQANPFFRTRRS